jgi:hypothetical protein
MEHYAQPIGPRVPRPPADDQKSTESTGSRRSPVEPESLPPLSPTETLLCEIRTVNDCLKRAMDALGRVPVDCDYVRKQLNLATGRIHRARVAFLEVEEEADSDGDDDIDTPLVGQPEDCIDPPKGGAS